MGRPLTQMLEVPRASGPLSQVGFGFPAASEVHRLWVAFISTISFGLWPLHSNFLVWGLIVISFFLPLLLGIGPKACSLSAVLLSCTPARSLTRTDTAWTPWILLALENQAGEHKAQAPEIQEHKDKSIFFGLHSTF